VGDRLKDYWRGALALAAIFAPVLVHAQPPPALAPGYHIPPAPIPAMIEAPPTPLVSLSHNRSTLAVVDREGLPPVARLARPILRLGGWRVDPQTNGPAEIRMNWLTGLAFEDVKSGIRRSVALPATLRFTALEWSPDDRKAAFVARTDHGLAVWVVGVGDLQAHQLTGPIVNGALGVKLAWTPDSAGVLFLETVPGRGAAPTEGDVSARPTVQESIGRSAPTRTYEDLLRNGHDEALFDYYFTAQLARVDVGGGGPKAIGAPGVISSFAPSPDGRFLLVETLHRPYSYNVPAGLFPTRVAVWDANGQEVKVVVDRPLADTLPIAFDATPQGPRDVTWRNDAPATLFWAEALDGGDPRRAVPFHDRLMIQPAPFSGQPKSLADLATRFYSIAWGRPDTAVVASRWWNTRQETLQTVDPSGTAAAHVFLQRNFQDQYKNPGTPLLTTGAYGRPGLAFASDGHAILVSGPGATKDGEHPFLGALSLADGRLTDLWRSEDAVYEMPVALLDVSGEALLTRRESRTDPPNYFARQVGAGARPRRLTSFPDPEPQFAGVTTQLVTYKRADGVNLSGALYLPAGYDKARDGPLPMLMWAYPTEFTDASVAGQVVDRSKNRFVRPQGISHLFLLTQGYAIFDGFSAPIIGTAGAEPNDTYVEQLVADAQAAVDAVVALGVADRNRIAVGGHSYGAFMTANLLAHSHLFRAGIARSGAYNRTLTPFGFQAEQRTYWQAIDTYTKMSPFTYAPQIKAPILLIHGEEDDNDGTFPIQSERFYAALKGAGATVRYVTLPYEPHGYRGLESTLEVLWEMNDWLGRYVKPPPSPTSRPPSPPAGGAP